MHASLAGDAVGARMAFHEDFLQAHPQYGAYLVPADMGWWAAYYAQPRYFTTSDPVGLGSRAHTQTSHTDDDEGFRSTASTVPCTPLGQPPPPAGRTSRMSFAATSPTIQVWDRGTEERPRGT